MDLLGGCGGPPPNPLVLIISSFSISLLFAPYSAGFLFFLIFLLGYEIIYAAVTGIRSPNWHLDVRLAVIAASFLGFITGKWIEGEEEPLRMDNSIPNLNAAEKEIKKAEWWRRKRW